MFTPIDPAWDARLSLTLPISFKKGVRFPNSYPWDSRSVRIKRFKLDNCSIIEGFSRLMHECEQVAVFVSPGEELLQPVNLELTNVTFDELVRRLFKGYGVSHDGFTGTVTICPGDESRYTHEYLPLEESVLKKGFEIRGEFAEFLPQVNKCFADGLPDTPIRIVAEAPPADRPFVLVVPGPYEGRPPTPLSIVCALARKVESPAIIRLTDGGYIVTIAPSFAVPTGQTRLVVINIGAE